MLLKRSPGYIAGSGRERQLARQALHRVHVVGLDFKIAGGDSLIQRNMTHQVFPVIPLRSLRNAQQVVLRSNITLAARPRYAYLAWLLTPINKVPMGLKT